MYETFYGLREEPFRLSPDSRLCYEHASYKRARSYMQYALNRREGFVMVTGRPGTGKTTLIGDITTDLTRQGNLFAALTSTQIQADDLLRLAGSLKLGRVPATGIMRTLQTGDRPTRLAQALAEFGRIEKTLHTLTYIDDESKRRATLTPTHDEYIEQWLVIGSGVRRHPIGPRVGGKRQFTARPFS